MLSGVIKTVLSLMLTIRLFCVLNPMRVYRSLLTF